MSNPKYFLHDICDFEIVNMECMAIVKSEEVLEAQDENRKAEKLRESYLLLKKKLSLSDELIKQYNDKVMECQKVSTELQETKDSLKKINQKHNSSLSKILKLELENREYRQNVENLTKSVSEQETKILADKQHLQQLIYKVQQLEQKEIIAGKLKKDDSLKERVKILETELKTTKETHKIEIKEMEMKLRSLKVTELVKNQTKKKETKISHEKATCTGNELEPVIAKAETQTVGTLTNEFYSIKGDPYPLFCSKCLIKLDPVPLDQILEHMTSVPTEVLSPLKESEINKQYRSPRGLSRNEFPSPGVATSNNRNNYSQSLDSIERISDVSKSDFQRLEQKICLLERKLHKKVKKASQDRNICCRFQYPNNCYLGPYPNIFQPGAMIQPQPDLFQIQNWQQGLRNRKRSRRSSNQRPNRRGTKSRKKLKLDDGTSEWNVDSVPSREFNDSDNANASENYSEPSTIPLRTESSPSQFSNPRNNASKHRKENRSCPTIRRRTSNKRDSLFTPVRSPSPELHDDMQEEDYSERRIQTSETSRVVNETFSDEDMSRNESETPEPTLEYEMVECGPKKQGKRAKKAAKPSTKRSLVTKIRNLKKNCNKVKPLVGKTTAGNNNTKKLISNQILRAMIPANKPKDSIQPVKRDQTSNGIDDYCTVKKHRIAHSAQKAQNDSFCKASKNLFTDTPETDFEDNPVIDDVKNDKHSETVEKIDKLDSFKEQIDTTGLMKDPKPVVRIERKNSSKDTADTECSVPIEKPAVKYFEVRPVPEITRVVMETESIAKDSLNPSESVAITTLHDKKVSSLQPCIMIPKIYLDIEGVDNPIEAEPSGDSNETEEDETVTNLNDSLRILRSKSKIIKSNDRVSLKTDSTIASDDRIDQNSIVKNHEATSWTMKVELTRCGGNINPSEYSDNEISDIHDTSISVKSEEMSNEIIEDGKDPPPVAVRKYKKRTRVTALPLSPMRELRSRRIMLSPLSSTKDENEETNADVSAKIPQASENISTQCIEGFGPRALIQRLLMKCTNSQDRNSGNRKKVNEKLQQRKENLVLKELSKLVEDVEWKSAVLLATVERLSKFKTHTIAKCTIDFLASRAEDSEELDKSHTPPAPLLTKTQQRILTMLVTLNRTMPNIIKLVQAGIEFRIFRLGYSPEVNVIEELARVFAALARIQKDRERVRILCCDALYCLGLKAMSLIYVISVSWPEVFPMAGTSSDPLLLCLIDSIMTQTGDSKFPKFFALKKLLTGYYSYESSGYDSNALARNFMTALREKRENGLDTAIVVLAKKKRTVWTYENIVQELLKMIIQKAHPSIYDAFCLLGHLMRSFPLDDKQGLVKKILEQLCALMESGEGSMQQQEGIATAILSLYRHKQMVVAKTILDWEPSEPLSESTSRQLTALFDSVQPGWWNKLLRNRRTKLFNEAKKSDKI